MNTIEIISKEMQNNNKPTFEDLSTEQMKQVVRNFNLHFIIQDFEKLSRKSVLEICENMLEIDVNGIRLKVSKPIVFKKDTDVPNKPKTDIRDQIDILTEKALSIGNLIAELNTIEIYINDECNAESDKKAFIESFNKRIGEVIVKRDDVRMTRRKAQQFLNEKVKRINVQIDDLYGKL